MPVPFIDLKRWETDFLNHWNAKVQELSRNAQFIGGAEVQKLEKILLRDCKTGFAVSCANGTDALQLSLRAAGVGPGDFVILPDFTFWATFEAIVNVGAMPLTVDIDPNDLQMEYELFCQTVKTYRPKAAILVHLYGWGSHRLQDFRSFCKQNEIILIEDGAQAYGSLYQGKSIYQEAQLATISFYPAKVFGAAGDGGAVLTSDEELAIRLRSLCNHGRQRHYSHFCAGWNSRLDSLQAAYLNLVHKQLNKRIQSRRRGAQAYRQAFANTKGIHCLQPPEDFQENGYLNVLLLGPQKRAECIQALEKKHIGYGITYPQTISEQKGAQAYLKGKSEGNIAQKISQSVLNLPLFPYIREEELEAAISVIARCVFSTT